MCCFYQLIDVIEVQWCVAYHANQTIHDLSEFEIVYGCKSLVGQCRRRSSHNMMYGLCILIGSTGRLHVFIN